MLTTCGLAWSTSYRHRPTFDKFGPRLANTDQYFAEAVQHAVQTGRFCRIWADFRLGDNWPTLVGQLLGNFRITSELAGIIEGNLPGPVAMKCTATSGKLNYFCRNQSATKPPRSESNDLSLQSFGHMDNLAYMAFKWPRKGCRRSRGPPSFGILRLALSNESLRSRALRSVRVRQPWASWPHLAATGGCPMESEHPPLRQESSGRVKRLSVASLLSPVGPPPPHTDPQARGGPLARARGLPDHGAGGVAQRPPPDGFRKQRHEGLERRRVPGGGGMHASRGLRDAAGGSTFSAQRGTFSAPTTEVRASSPGV